MIKPGAAVVGAGTSWEGKKLLSDVDEGVAEVAGWITPRIGGVGPMTRAMLLRNAVRAASVRHERPERNAAGQETDQRPWGSYTVLDDEPTSRSSASRCCPGKRLSYQRHARRSEHWFIVHGTAVVTLDGSPARCRPGGAVDVPVGTAHRIENASDELVVFVEVQHGDYFGEDDIVRLEDDYGRTDA